MSISRNLMNRKCVERIYVEIVNAMLSHRFHVAALSLSIRKAHCGDETLFTPHLLI